MCKRKGTVDVFTGFDGPMLQYSFERRKKVSARMTKPSPKQLATEVLAGAGFTKAHRPEQAEDQTWVGDNARFKKIWRISDNSVRGVIEYDNGREAYAAVTTVHMAHLPDPAVRSIRLH